MPTRLDHTDIHDDGAGASAHSRLWRLILLLTKCRLCFRVTLVVFLSILAIEAVILVPSYFSRERTAVAQLDGLGRSVIRLVLNHEDTATVRRLTIDEHDLTRLWPVVGIAIYDDTGALLAKAGETPRLDLGAGAVGGAVAGAGAETPAIGEDATRRREVVWHGSALQLPFTVVARLDRSGVAEEMRGFVWRIAGLTLLIALIVSGATIAVLVITVFRPLLKIRGQLLAATSDPKHADRFTVDESSPHELGDIAEALNMLLIRLTRNYRSDIDHSEQRFQDFAGSASDWFWEMDEHLRFSYFSERFTEVTGVPQEALIGKTRQETGIPDVDPVAWRQHLADLAAHRQFRGFAHPRTKADGQEVWLSINGKPYFDSDGRFRGYRGTGADITGFKEAEAALRDSRDKAEQASKAKSEFLANMSHELRTPLNAIIGFADLMDSELFGTLNPRYRDYARDIRTSGRHLLGVISDILDLSKVEAGAVELQENWSDLRDIFDTAIRLNADRAARAGIAVRKELPNPTPYVYADEQRLIQILINLISNAIKFSQNHEDIVAGVHHDEGGLEVFVRDKGIGMSPEDIALALEPFRQADGGVNKKHEGTGLGLPLAKRLAELHDARFGIESEPGKGTTITVHIPSHRVGAVPKAAAARR